MSSESLSVTFDTGREKRFSNLNEVKDWADSERRLAKWMTGSLIQYQSKLGALVHSFREDLTNLSAHCDRSDEPDARRLLEKIQASYQGLLSESRAPTFLVELASRNPKFASAVLALALERDKSAPHENNSTIYPQFWAAEALLTAFRLSPDVVRVDIQKLVIEAERIRGLLTDALEKFTSKSETASSSFDSSVAERESMFSAELARFRSEFSDLMSESRKEFEKQRGFFVRELSLQAPITYWKSVAKSAGIWSRIWGIAFAAEVALLVWFAYVNSEGVLAFLVSNKERLDLGLVIALVIATSTLVFWAMRMTARIFLSNYHRSADARERFTMLQTFLALRHENKLEDAHIALALGAIFRPGSTGLVKDDAAPEFGTAAILSRFDRK
ncbi:MAG: hypothetical protein AMXMBFR36_27930 [Acidobacteriota bacterium]